MEEKKLIADQMRSDAEFLEAKRRLVALAKSYGEKIQGPRPPDGEKEVSYREILEKFGSDRGGKLWYPYLGSGIGRGPLVELADGSVKYDMIGGIGVHLFGHSHPEVIEASIETACGDVVMQGNLQQNRESVGLCRLLVEASGKQHCFLSTSGVMAVENGLKAAFQKNFPADRILAFSHCFAGRTLAASQITDKAIYREGLPRTLLVDYIPFFDANDPVGSSQRALAALEGLLRRYPKQYAAMCLELIQGEGGVYPAPREFFLPLLERLKREGIAVLVDEVQTFGRTYELFAFQMLQLEEYVDIVAMGKVSQVCATLFDDAFQPRAGLLSQTFTGSLSAIVVAQRLIQLLREGGYYGPQGKILALHQRFKERLHALSERGLVQGPFGLGAMIAFTPFGGEKEKVLAFLQRLFERGVIGFVAGVDPVRARFLPPALGMTLEEVDLVMDIVEEVLLS